MTRKHFILLAQEISAIADYVARHSAAKAVAIACKSINPAFNRERFFEACGVLP